MRNVCVAQTCLLGTLANIRAYIFFVSCLHIKLIHRAPFVFASLFSIYFAIPFGFFLLHCQMLRAKVGNVFLPQLLSSLPTFAASYCRGTCCRPSPPSTLQLYFNTFTSRRCCCCCRYITARSLEFMFVPVRQVNELQQISPACGLLGGIYLFIYRARCNKDTIWRQSRAAAGTGTGARVKVAGRVACQVSLALWLFVVCG